MGDLYGHGQIRRSIAILGTLGLMAGMLAINIATASAAACHVSDGAVSSANLQSVINGATTGDTIVIKGTCTGNFAIPGGGSATNLTLRGKRGTSLNGNGSGSVLEVGASVTVTIKGLVLKNGNAFNGGGIDIEGDGSTHVNLRGMTRVTGNTATSSGGGVFDSVGYLSVGGHAKINGNTALYGGGIYGNFGQITLQGHGLVQGNTAATDGGGIYHDNGGLFGAVAGVNVKSNSPNDIAP